MGHRIDCAKVAPDVYKAFGRAYVAVRKSGLPKQRVDLVYLRVSQIDGCAYCIDRRCRCALPMGTGYAVWTGIGAAGTAIVGMVVPGDSAAPMRLPCIALIPAGVIGLKRVTSDG
ncbi:SMR family transporter [Verminephrobacter eiseniae]|uniref:SMR family transporter n=1 Tax=Verminephrobacter eiseniae TaxID=364317 RepID=UPI002AA2A362|nr:SMR family transporter [Verminephrobacter eiseniae]